MDEIDIYKNISLKDCQQLIYKYVSNKYSIFDNTKEIIKYSEIIEKKIMSDFNGDIDNFKDQMKNKSNNIKKEISNKNKEIANIQNEKNIHVKKCDVINESIETKTNELNELTNLNDPDEKIQNLKNNLEQLKEKQFEIHKIIMEHDTTINLLNNERDNLINALNKSNEIKDKYKKLVASNNDMINDIIYGKYGLIEKSEYANFDIDKLLPIKNNILKYHSEFVYAEFILVKENHLKIRYTYQKSPIDYVAKPFKMKEYFIKDGPLFEKYLKMYKSKFDYEKNTTNKYKNSDESYDYIPPTNFKVVLENSEYESEMIEYDKIMGEKIKFSERHKNHEDYLKIKELINELSA
uniref:Uncharacterized protein n=1 Tax=viral metagenome TaxID=1070528 RepID=A0A6C0H567_9ZZZZ